MSKSAHPAWAHPLAVWVSTTAETRPRGAASANSTRSGGAAVEAPPLRRTTWTSASGQTAARAVWAAWAHVGFGGRYRFGRAGMSLA